MNSSLGETLRMIKIEHSIFAMPFALAAAFLAARGLPDVRIFVLIIFAVVFARSAAMAFNRYVDAEIDLKNPRTAERSIPAGRLTRRYALGFTLISSLLFVAVTFLLNWLTAALSPLMLLILLGYSYTKRFTRYCHLVLGLALGCAPIGAWAAVRGTIEATPLLIGLAVMLWTAGFDIIYACQDIDFDRDEKLHSLPARIGLHRALMLSRVMHLSVIVILAAVGVREGLSIPYWLGLLIAAACLTYEQYLIRDGDMKKVTTAFFTMNGLVSLTFGAAVIISLYV